MTSDLSLDRSTCGLVALLAVHILAIPGPLLLLLPTLAAVNPVGLAFATEFRIVNSSDVVVHVTPVGAPESGRDRVLLPPVPKPRAGSAPRPIRDARLAPGEVLDFRYDWDDVVLTEVVVRLPVGPLRKQVVVDLPAGPAPTIRRPTISEVDIDHPELLSVAEPFVTAPVTMTPPTWRLPRSELVVLSVVHFVSGVVLLVIASRWVRNGSTTRSTRAAQRR